MGKKCIGNYGIKILLEYCIKNNGIKHFIHNYIKQYFGILHKNEQPQGKPCGIEDFSLKSSRMRGNVSPAPPAMKRPKGRGIKPLKGYALNKSVFP
jgi:hypothetical protein